MVVSPVCWNSSKDFCLFVCLFLLYIFHRFRLAHLSVVQNLIFLLQRIKDFSFVIDSGTSFHIFGAKKQRDTVTTKI